MSASPNVWPTDAGRERHVVTSAVEYLRQAGEGALAVSAHDEARRHLDRALELLATVPASAERDTLELALQVPLAACLFTGSGPAAPELSAILERSRDLARTVSHPPAVVPALAMLAVLSATRGEYALADDFDQRARAIASEHGSDDLVAATRAVTGAVQLRCGRLEAARLDLEQSPPGQVAVAFRAAAGGVDVDVWRLAWLAYALWFLGYPDQALASAEQAVVHARRSGEPLTLVHALHLRSSVRLHRGEAEIPMVDLLEAGELASSRGFASYQMIGLFLQGWALARCGRLDEGISGIRTAVSASRAAGFQLDQTKYLSRLGEACLAAGRLNEAIAAVEDGLASAARTGETYYLPELHRLRGEVHWAAGTSDLDVDAAFRQALAAAEVQHARAWVLRTRTSLARWSQARGEADEAARGLSVVIGDYAEGLETGDIRAAREVLASLGSAG